MSPITENYVPIERSTYPMPVNEAAITSFPDSSSQVTDEVYSFHHTGQTGHLIVSKRPLYENQTKLILSECLDNHPGRRRNIIHYTARNLFFPASKILKNARKTRSVWQCRKQSGFIANSTVYTGAHSTLSLYCLHRQKRRSTEAYTTISKGIKRVMVVERCLIEVQGVSA